MKMMSNTSSIFWQYNHLHFSLTSFLTAVMPKLKSDCGDRNWRAKVPIQGQCTQPYASGSEQMMHLEKEGGKERTL